MSFSRRWRYLRRVVSTYVGGRGSNLSFWHEQPAREPRARPDDLVHYFMPFHGKANHVGPYTSQGVPLLDYSGDIGPQINPIAVAQFGLGNLNLWRDTGDEDRLARARVAGDELVRSLTPNGAGIPVWMHRFDWDYRDTLKAPWYSGLAQGQGISLLARLNAATGENEYRSAAERAFQAMTMGVEDGGVLHIGPDGSWIEEYIVDPPTHILNGFLWALWGVHDFAVMTSEPTARDLFAEGNDTVLRNLDRYDTGYWSLYELSGTRLPMVASFFYHHLHVVQLEVMRDLTGDARYTHWRDRWAAYQTSSLSRRRAGINKLIFKLVHY